MCAMWTAETESFAKADAIFDLLGWKIGENAECDIRFQTIAYYLDSWKQYENAYGDENILLLRLQDIEDQACDSQKFRNFSGRFQALKFTQYLVNKDVNKHDTLLLVKHFLS